MNNLQYSNERTIRIKDLIITICQRWRSLIVCLVIGAVVLGALGWLKSVDDVIYTQEQAEAIALSLGSKRAGVIESFAEDIKDSTDQIIRQGIYNKDALIMKLDPFHLFVHELKFYIGDVEEAESTATKHSAMVQAYVSKLQDGFLGQKLKAVIEEEAGEKQREFYESPNLIKVDETNQTVGILTFLLYFEEGDDAKAVSLLKEKMRETKSQVEAELGSHSLSLIGESAYSFADMDILHVQEANSQRINDLTERIEKIKKQVTDPTELQYLNYLVSKTDQTIGGSELAVKGVRHINKKYIVVGAALGLILAVIVITIKYVGSNTIKNAKDIEELFGVQLLGKMEGSHSFYRKRKTRLDKWLRNKKSGTVDIVQEEEQIRLIATRIKIEAEKKEIQKVGLIIDKTVDAGSKMAESITALLGQDIKLQVINSIFDQPESLQEFAKMEGVVLIEQTDKSRYDDIRTTAALCANYQVQLIGSIIIE